MSKALVSEILGVLRQFEIAGALTLRKEISRIKEVSPRMGVRIISFAFGKTLYHIVSDATADDDTQYLLELIQNEKPDVRGAFIRNPHDDTATYGLRHKFKDVYLFEEKALKRRLDLELVERHPDLSRSTVQKYIKAGYVTVDGEVASSPKHEVSELNTIAITPPAKIDTSKQELPIVYIDDNVIVVNKPVGVLTHSKGVMNDEFTVADFFRRYTTNALDTTRPGIVHRLDRDTSGIIIGARNDETALTLKKQFSDRTVKKQYAAVVIGMPKLDKAIIDLPIGRNPSAPSTFRVDPKGKPAITTYEVLATNGDKSLLELRPKTGRTHQLRVHMQYIRTPIAGDKVYGTQASAPRLCLHAHKLEITIPTSDRKVFTAEVPAEFREIVQ